jgi:hypothetical protein
MVSLFFFGSHRLKTDLRSCCPIYAKSTCIAIGAAQNTDHKTNWTRVAPELRKKITTEARSAARPYN